VRNDQALHTGELIALDYRFRRCFRPHGISRRPIAKGGLDACMQSNPTLVENGHLESNSGIGVLGWPAAIFHAPDP